MSIWRPFKVKRRFLLKKWSPEQWSSMIPRAPSNGNYCKSWCGPTKYSAIDCGYFPTTYLTRTIALLDEFAEAPWIKQMLFTWHRSMVLHGSRSRRDVKVEDLKQKYRTFSDYYSWECFSSWPWKCKSMFLQQEIFKPRQYLHLSVYYLVWHIVYNKEMIESGIDWFLDSQIYLSTEGVWDEESRMMIRSITPADQATAAVTRRRTSWQWRKGAQATLEEALVFDKAISLLAEQAGMLWSLYWRQKTSL